MKIVLVDIDGVLAIGPDGADCTASQEIHRTSHGTLIPAPASDTHVVLLTHRQKNEAEQIVAALGLGGVVNGLICADDMLGQWFRHIMRGRLMPGLTKDLCAPILHRRFGWSGPEVTAFIDDRQFNLERLHVAGVARHCILVPRPQVDGALVRSVAVARAIRLAYGLLDGAEAAAHDAIVRLEWEAEPSRLDHLATGVKLRVRATPAAILRAWLRAARRWTARLSRGGQGL